ncbi:Acid protease [Venustampulla echinocandica]|uniref:Acid protease n=1 Tax=Venustampulla echinocandica TaxID=2656787 RepID=A0A370TCJ8_9HELO|nr:Acid protease [Venustampulla echinocandica]RDL31972.1 Acid protease [Venustampulla echinocandica]
MPSLHSLCVLTLVTLALAAPAPAPENAPLQKRSFKVERVPNPHFKRSPGAGHRALLNAHRKYSIPLPPGLLDVINSVQLSEDEATPLTNGKVGNVKTKGNKSRPAGASAPGAAASNVSAAAGTGIVTATPERGDVEYLAPVTIGGQTMNLNFDSGSSDLWIFNTQLSVASQKGHTNFDPAKSATFKAMPGATFSISYGDGSGASGNVGTDTVDIGGVSVKNQAIELATAVSASFVADANSNGLVGLAFSKLNTVKPQKQKTFFDNVMPSLAEPVFTADLRKAAVGAYEFGRIDTARFNGSLTWTPVNTTQGFWQVTSQKFQVGSRTAITVPGAQAIADTGTTLMLVNDAVVNAYYSQVSGAVKETSGVVFPCNAKLPDLSVDINGAYMAVVKGSDINFAPADNTGTTCFGGVQSIASNLQIYGDIMFKSQFVAFHGGNNSLGMAPHQ